MRLLFLTTTNLTTNPRLLKEVKLALEIGLKPTVVLFDFNNWTAEIERGLCASLSEVKVITIHVTRSSFKNWFEASALQTIYRNAYKHLITSLRANAFASDKRSYLLWCTLKRLHLNYDLIVAHNLGALYSAYKLSKKLNIPFSFDVEDYHPGEAISSDTENEVERRKLLMQRILPEAAYVTAASPLIADAVRQLCDIKVNVINNSFNSSEFTLHKINLAAQERVRFVWFSQNINHSRGLELILPALDKYSEKLTLTLIGNPNKDFTQKWLLSREYISIVPPLEQKELHQYLSKHDVGLALELSSADHNRNLALTNKIFAYKQAGLYILATDTAAQMLFMEQFKNDGIVSKQDPEAMAESVLSIISSIGSIRAGKINRFKQAKEIAFETEAQKLVALWERALQKQA